MIIFYQQLILNFQHVSKFPLLAKDAYVIFSCFHRMIIEEFFVWLALQ